MHAERDIVLPIQPACLCPMPVLMAKYCIHTNAHIVTLFDIQVGALINIFEPHHRYKILMETFLEGALNIRR